MDAQVGGGLRDDRGLFFSFPCFLLGLFKSHGRLQGRVIQIFASKIRHSLSHVRWASTLKLEFLGCRGFSKGVILKISGGDIGFLCGWGGL